MKTYLGKYQGSPEFHLPHFNSHLELELFYLIFIKQNFIIPFLFDSSAERRECDLQTTGPWAICFPFLFELSIFTLSLTKDQK
ncbi:hypothetical protein BpHYR1_020706 [Brachionus plicatilis]|uniref:Uncharacterized protein n=1 Tax=Brachionus plicatilis TaxID=10195 RepID=A0A3M7PZQ6_BRAPC|nr:hypothetical protein BpHYR1_020706 [Brachionus plicatilis]